MARKSKNYLEFEWDQGNIDKNWIKHKITNHGAEQVFVDKFAFITPDVKHSTLEPRYQILGQTFEDKYLTVYYTQRENKIRVISSRSMSRKEKNQYDKQKKV